MATQTPDTSWTAKGSIYNPKVPDSPTLKQPIPIPEKGMNVHLPTCKDPLGSPIDADLAVHFICNYLKLVNGMNSDKEYIRSHNVDNLDPNRLLTIAQKAIALNENTFNLNYGMTVDKNLAFKILSQTGCEGLRFYLCAKPYPPVPQLPGGAQPPVQQQLSLVVVGVDCEGFDLNYPKNTHYLEDGSAVAADGIFITTPTGSLPGEYVVPPKNSGNTVSSFFDNKDESEKTSEQKAFSNRFALLNIARKKSPK